MSDLLCSQTLSVIYSTTYWSYLLHFLWCFHLYEGHVISDNEQLNSNMWRDLSSKVVMASELCKKCYCIYRLGLDPKVLMETINSSSGRCWSSEVYCPIPGTMDNVPSSNDYKVISLIIILQCILYGVMMYNYLCTACKITYSTKYILQVHMHVCRYSRWVHSRLDTSRLLSCDPLKALSLNKSFERDLLVKMVMCVNVRACKQEKDLK